MRQARGGDALIEQRFSAEVIYWRGPSPFFYVPLPLAEAAELKRAAAAVTYGWGMIPVEAEISGVTFTTSLFPKEGTYYLPIKAAVRKTTRVTAGDTISLRMTVYAPA